MRRLVLLLTLVLPVALAWCGRATAAENVKREAAKPGLELALQYDFFGAEGTRVGDASGNEHHGLLHGGEIVLGRKRPAVKLDGKGSISVAETPDSLSPAARPFTVGALCQPMAADGVIAAMGDKANGFSLYLTGGVPHFAVRAGGELAQVAGDEPVPLDQWVHLCGAIGTDGKLWLFVNGWPTANAKGRLIPKKPAEPLCIGADSGSPVGDYAAPLNWQGLMEEVRLYWGLLDRNEDREILQEWADLPGCGCRK